MKLNIFITVLLLCIINAGCATKVNHTDPIIIGAVYNLNGSQSALDIPSANAAKLAVLRANQNGGVLGRNVELVIMDGDTDPDIVSSVTSELITSYPSVSAIQGLSDTDMVLAAAPIAADSEIMFITSGATSPKLPEQIPEYLFLACFGDNVQAAAAAEWAYNDMSLKTASILYNSTETYTDLLQGYFSVRYGELDGLIVSTQGFTSETLDSIDLNLEDSDMVFLSAEPQDVINGINLLRNAGFEGPIIGGDGFDSDELWENNPPISDVYFTTHAYLGSNVTDPDVQEFIDAYKDAYNQTQPNAFSALGYDTVNLILEAIKEAESSESSHVRDALSNITGFKGITGTFNYSSDSRIPRKSVTIISIYNGTKSLEKQILPDKVPAP